MTPPSRGTVVTDPDPTEAVKEALTLAVKNLEEKVDLRFNNHDAAVRLAREELREQLQYAKEANKELVNQLATANQVALTAALQTQKESAAKSDLSMTDRLKQLQDNIETSIRTTNEKIDRLTSRADLGEGNLRRALSNRVDSREDDRDNRKHFVDNRSSQIALVGVISTVVGVLISWAFGLHR
jgi:hypothetical protein